MLEIPALPSWRFSSPIENSSMEISPSPITLCMHWSKFVTYIPSHGDCGGVSRPQRHSYKVVRLAEKMAISEWLSPRRGPRCPPFFLVTYKGH